MIEHETEEELEGFDQGRGIEGCMGICCALILAVVILIGYLSYKFG